MPFSLLQAGYRKRDGLEMPNHQSSKATEASRGAFPVTYRVAPGKLKHGLLIAGLLSVIGLWLIFFAGPMVAHGQLAGFANLAMAAGLVVIALRRVRDPRALLVLDQSGIWYRDWGLDPIAWNRIASVTLGGSRLQSFAYLEVTDSLLGGLSAEQRRKAESNRLVRPPRLLIPNGALDAPLPEIVAAIRSGLEERP